MAEIVNLNKARKRRERDAGRALADQNRHKYGRPKHVRRVEKQERESEMRALDGKRLEDSVVHDRFGKGVTSNGRDNEHPRDTSTDEE